MIESYKYVKTVHSTLNEYVMAFFEKIKTDNNGFRVELFDPSFRSIVKRHRIVLNERFKTIYKHVSALPQTERIQFCQMIIDSNQIQKICCGGYRPKAFSDKPTGIEKTIKDLFICLYEQVLDGDPFRDSAKATLREHFNAFSNANKDITLCPMCGIGELKKAQDKTRDQYDHYLPKALYPFSSINFFNLVPCCLECNSFSAKGEKDILEISTGKLFFPYDENHKGISLTAKVKIDNSVLEKIEWEMVFSNPDKKDDEIESWKRIYSIESRYEGYIKARVQKWYKHYYICMSKKSVSDFTTKDIIYWDMIEQDNDLGVCFIRFPVLKGLIEGSNLVQAEREALKYS